MQSNDASYIEAETVCSTIDNALLLYRSMSLIITDTWPLIG